MKKVTLLAAMLVVMMLLSLSAMAAPLANPNLDITPLDAFKALENGEQLVNTDSNGRFWVFHNGSGGNIAYENGHLVFGTTAANPDLPYAGRINLGDAAVSIEDMAGITGVAVYVENNSEMEAGIGFFGECTDANGREHQLYYSDADFSDVTCYLVDADGNITRGKEYADYSAYGQASVPAGFKGWFLIDLENGGFNYCSYNAWGYDDPPCDGAFKQGRNGLSAVGFNVCADLMEEETVLLGDYAFWTAKTVMPEEGQVLRADGTLEEEGESSAPTQAPTEALTAAPTQNTEPATTEGAEPTTTTPAAPAGRDHTLLYVGIIAAVTCAAVVVIFLTAPKRKKDVK